MNLYNSFWFIDFHLDSEWKWMLEWAVAMFYFLASPSVAINDSQERVTTSGNICSQQHCRFVGDICGK